MPIDDNTWEPAIVAAAAITWSDASDTITGSRWLAPLDIGGALLHLEARLITRDNDDNMAFVEWPEDLDALNTIYPETIFTTADGNRLGLPAGEYVLFAYPYGE